MSPIFGCSVSKCVDKTRGKHRIFLDLNPEKSEKVQINPREKTQRNVILLMFFFDNFNVGVNPL